MKKFFAYLALLVFIQDNLLPIAITPNAQYLRLKKEHEVLMEKAIKLDNSTMYFDYLPNPAIAIECVDGNPNVYRQIL
ncbi:hypothetical protein SAMN05660841_02575 [Sphingobacterium nematocida]|uniref:Uncharacterized protein n=1 Tax=Sphingobacterium nematocida TaxID=1513896 RepID=A0A1T5EGQ0_9SPHI|nr:hypothetical protein [Sphingobacterium nematocida]SKB83223.1 hypothetical protein SAMN05660841_02575 [Sphingobacterium nematocida]